MLASMSQTNDQTRGTADTGSPDPLAAFRDPSSKLRHIEACLDPAIEYRKTTGLEQVELTHEALPELSLAEIDLSITFCGRRVAAPLMIAPMTGGTGRAVEINRRLARAAERFAIPIGVGSQRVALEDPSRADQFAIRADAPTAFVFANLGAAQLVRGWGFAEAQRAVEMVAADALFIHINPMQEAIQSGGDRDFRGVASALTRLCHRMSRDGVPIFAREVCFGISERAAQMLAGCGVAGIDCSGAGGTSWTKVEAACSDDPRLRALGATFGEWGIPTAEAIRNVRRGAPGLPLIASGGLRSGLDLARAIALGAHLGAMARPFLLAAVAGQDAVDDLVRLTLDELRITMLGCGARSVGRLGRALAATA